MQFRSPTFRLLSPFLIERPFIEVLKLCVTKFFAQIAVLN